MQKHHSGFTLIELMITIAIVSIVAAIAIPSYSSHMVKTRRAAASSCLLELSQVLERGFVGNNSFVFDIDGDGNRAEGVNETLSGQCVTDTENFYDYSLATLSKTAYKLTATPTPAQYDPACEALSIDQAGKLSVSGDAELDVKACWNK